MYHLTGNGSTASAYLATRSAVPAMYIRFLDVLVHAAWYERKLYAEALIAAEDLRSIPQVQELTGISPKFFILVGIKRRCRIYQHLLCNKVDSNYQVRMITSEEDIDHLSIHGVITLAKIKGIL